MLRAPGQPSPTLVEVPFYEYYVDKKTTNLKSVGPQCVSRIVIDSKRNYFWIQLGRMHIVRPSSVLSFIHSEFIEMKIRHVKTRNCP